MKKISLVTPNILSIMLLCALAVPAVHAQQPDAKEVPVIVILNARVFDGKGDHLSAPATILIRSNLIEQIGEKVDVPPEATVIDAGGKTVMPGLIDMHWHSAYANLLMETGLTTDLAYHALIGAKGNTEALLRGFTTVRDVGGNVFSLAKLTNEGIYDGPRIFPSGPAISQTSGHTDFRPATAVPADPDMGLVYMERIGHVMVADGVPEVLKRSREALRMGATQIKINSGGGVSSAFDPLDVTQFTLAETKAAVDAAADWNTYVATHVFTDAAAQRALEAGVLSIEHGHLLSEKTLQMMKEKGAFLSMQPILDDEDAIPFPAGSFSRQKYVQVTRGTDRG